MLHFNSEKKYFNEYFSQFKYRGYILFKKSVRSSSHENTEKGTERFNKNISVYTFK